MIYKLYMKYVISKNKKLAYQFNPVDSITNLDYENELTAHTVNN